MLARWFFCPLHQCYNPVLAVQSLFWYLVLDDCKPFLTFCAGEFQCPVLNKVFTEFTHIVAVKTTGNVFCYEVCYVGLA